MISILHTRKESVGIRTVTHKHRQHEQSRQDKKYRRLSSTPTTIVNGHMLPHEYKIEDLIYFIDKATKM